VAPWTISSLRNATSITKHFRRIALEYDISGSKADAELAKRALKIMTILEPASQALQKITECIIDQLDDCKKQITALHARSGVSSLPDEILSIVLEHVERIRTRIASVRATCKLSHVCSWFRRLVINDPSLWNTISIGMNQGMLLSCIECSGGTGIRVVFDKRFNTTGTSDAAEFINAVMTTSGNGHVSLIIWYSAIKRSWRKWQRQLVTRDVRAPELS